jgi:CRP-like cAMP-binding protein
MVARRGRLALLVKTGTRGWPGACHARAVADRVDARAVFEARLRREGLTEADLAPIAAVTRARTLARGEAVLRAGDRPTHAGVVVSGVLREYFPLDDGREVTRGFAGPGSFLGSLSDLLVPGPARSTVSAEAETEVVLTPWTAIQAAATRHPAWAALLARTTERLYLAKAEREYELLALDATERYRRFRLRYAALEAAISQRHVASYIGVTPEHLSRLRRALGVARPTSGRRPAPARSRR